MVRKHPMIFTSSDVAVLNKVDLAGYMEVDVEVLRSDYNKIVRNKTLHLMSVKTGEGIGAVMKAIGASK
jgi:Ni2+-binding GTPase involved in maturation of urease and hydrogenase